MRRSSALLQAAASAAAPAPAVKPRSARSVGGESPIIQATLIAVSLAFLLLFLLLPLITVFVEAGARGWAAYREAMGVSGRTLELDPEFVDALHRTGYDFRDPTP